MTADQLGQRQIEQAHLVLIDHAAMFLVGGEILAEDEGRRAQLVGARRMTSQRRIVLRPDDDGHAAA